MEQKNEETQNNWYETPQNTTQQTAKRMLPKWLIILSKSILCAGATGAIFSTLLAIIGYFIPANTTPPLNFSAEIMALLVNMVFGFSIGFFSGAPICVILTFIIIYIFKGKSNNFDAYFKIALIGIVTGIVVLFGFQLVHFGEISSRLPLYQYFIALVSGILATFLFLKSPLKT